MLGQARRSQLPIIRLPMYVNDPVYIPKVRSLLEATEGVAQVLGERKSQPTIWIIPDRGSWSRSRSRMPGLPTTTGSMTIVPRFCQDS